VVDLSLGAIRAALPGAGDVARVGRRFLSGARATGLGDHRRSSVLSSRGHVLIVIVCAVYDFDLN
jgi:hypothetical protein